MSENPFTANNNNFNMNTNKSKYYIQIVAEYK